MGRYRQNPPPMVDILIRGWGNWRLVDTLISSINENTKGVDYQVILVDNGSEVPYYDAVNFHGATYVLLPFNHGSVRAINVGLQLAMLSPAPYILLLDNDTEIPSGDTGWLTRWLKYFEDEKVGAAGAVSDYVSGVQYVESVPDRYTKSFEENCVQFHKESQETPLLVSFAMMMRKTAVEQVGLWDERFEPGNGEDYDASIRFRLAGWKLVVAESVYIHHKGSQTFKSMGYDNLVQTAYRKLLEKWGAEKLAELGLAVRTR